MTTRTPSTFSAALVLIARLALGALLVISVIVRVFSGTSHEGFAPPAVQWLSAMDATGYLTPLLLATEFVVGCLLLGGRFVPLALIFFAPINLNIFLLHLLLDPRPARLVQIVVMAVAHLFLVWSFRSAFQPMLSAPPAVTLLDLIRRREWRGIPVVRTLLGALFVITGMAKLTGAANANSALLNAMQDTGYLYTLLGMAELSVGLILVIGRLVPLALVMLAPILGNILLYHLFQDRTSILAGVALLAGIALAVLAWHERAYYAPLFARTGRVLPGTKAPVDDKEGR